MNEEQRNGVREVLQRFQEGYARRDVSRLDEFMSLFAPGEDIEMIGVGAAARGGSEWFHGPAQVRDIVEGDWTYWGDVAFDTAEAKITVRGDTAWLSTTGSVTQTGQLDESLPLILKQMRELLADDRQDGDARLLEATYYGMRRVRERHKGVGHSWPFVLTAVLVRTDGRWGFHTLHWSMPVE